jgi:TatD DNase family protein
MSDLVDTHCHIQSVGLDQGERITREMWAKSGLNAATVLSNASDGDVTRMVCVGCDLADSQLAVEFVQGKDKCWASIGIHPHEAQHFAGRPDKLEEFAALAGKPKVVAVGECGFDFYYNHSPKEAQTQVLKFQIGLALKKDLPIIFHVREAFDDFWPVFDSYSGVRGVLHSFTDSRENMIKAIERGLHIGVNGIATFTKDQGQLETYKAIPLERLLLETDAPFLTPVPFRGSINEPGRLGAVADFIAGLRGIDRDELAKATTTNARQLFGLS